MFAHMTAHFNILVLLAGLLCKRKLIALIPNTSSTTLNERKSDVFLPFLRFVKWPELGRNALGTVESTGKFESGGARFGEGSTNPIL